MTTINEYLTKLNHMLEKGELYDVAVELESYFSVFKPDDYWAEQAKKALHALSEKTNDLDKVPAHTRSLILNEIKADLKKVIAVIRDNANGEQPMGDGSNVKVPEKIRESAEEKFKILLSWQQLAIQLKGKNSTTKGIVVLLLVAGIAAAAWFIIQHAPCDCASIKEEIQIKENQINSLQANMDSLNHALDDAPSIEKRDTIRKTIAAFSKEKDDFRSELSDLRSDLTMCRNSKDCD